MFASNNLVPASEYVLLALDRAGTHLTAKVLEGDYDQRRICITVNPRLARLCRIKWKVRSCWFAKLTVRTAADGTRHNELTDLEYAGMDDYCPCD